METTYSTAEVCLNEGPCLSLEPGEQPSPAPDLKGVLLLKRHRGWVRAKIGGHGVLRVAPVLGTDLEEIMATSRDQKELLWAWQGWRDAVGRQIRPIFEYYVQLSNEAAQYNGKQAGHDVLGQCPGKERSQIFRGYRQQQSGCE